MKLFNFLEKKIHNFKWYDMSLVKTWVMSFTLMIACLLPVLTEKVSRRIYGIIFAVTYWIMMYRMFWRKQK